MVTNREYKKSCTGFNPRTRAKWPTRGQDVKVLNNILTLGHAKMPMTKHDLAQLCDSGSNTRPKLIYFEPMFLGLWLRVTLEWT